MSTVSAHTFLHVGIPANDLQESKQFYMDVLGLKVTKESTGNYGNAPVRLHCGDGGGVAGQQVVLFKRPRPLDRDAIAEDGDAHHAFVVSPAEFDAALVKFKELGIFHRGPIVWPTSTHRTLYFFDPAGNYLQLADDVED